MRTMHLHAAFGAALLLAALAGCALFDWNHYMDFADKYMK